jgi:hypothetical protein
MDAQWWAEYGREVEREFSGTRYSFGLTPHATQLVQLDNFGNSGAGAIALAVAGGASRVIMLGYDCQHTYGKAHWHGDHPIGMGNAAMSDKWAKRFELMAHKFESIEILNASRVTALECFRRVDLEDALNATT